MRERIWTASNALSVVRVLLILPAGYCLTAEFPYHRLWAAGIIAVAILTDFLDGYFARKLHQVSELGKVIDPLADKIAVGVVTVILVWVGDIPFWFLTVVVARDALIVLGGLFIRKKKKIIVQSNWPGKIAVTAVAVYLMLSALRMDSLESFRQLTLWFSVVLMVLSLALYARRLFIG
ncbi:MAG: CDP-alcohol phosphatidyltransferase family protein, partial [Bacteroidota bacterium]